jgi:hypothetical protein
MRFYIPVGPRGIVFRIGMVTTGVMGSLSYWQASRSRRSATPTEPSPPARPSSRVRHGRAPHVMPPHAAAHQ